MKRLVFSSLLGVLALAITAVNIYSVTPGAGAQPTPDPLPKASPKGRGYKPLTPEKSKAVHAERFKKHDHRMRSIVAAATPPAEFDAKDMGWAGDVGDQGQCGSCYLYSTVKIATGAFVKAGYGKVDVLRLSFQYGMDCHDFGGCDGGNGTEVIDWMTKNGWPAENYVDATGKTVSDYPAYEASSGRCRLKPDAKKWFPKDWHFITSDQSDRPATVEEYKAALLAYGRVNVALDAGGQFGNYSGGVIASLGRSIDHEINVRGYSDVKQALLLENQWGSGWGGAKSPGDGCAWLSYKAVAGLQDPFVVSADVLPPPPSPTLVTVPSVVGTSYVTAGLNISSGQLVFAPSTYPDGSALVTAQSPVAGAQVGRGSTVTLTMGGPLPPPQPPVGPTTITVTGNPLQPGTYTIAGSGDVIIPRAEAEILRDLFKSVMQKPR